MFGVLYTGGVGEDCREETSVATTAKTATTATATAAVTLELGLDHCKIEYKQII